MRNTRCIIAILAITASAHVAAQAAATAPPAAASPAPAMAMPAATPSSTTLVEGQVRKVDKDAGKITLKHGPIPNLDMPAMTMVYRVSDPAFLDAVKPGDKLRFAAEMVNGALTITQIAPEK